MSYNACRKIKISLVPHNYAKWFAAPISEAIKKALKLKASQVWTEPYGGAHSEKDTMIVSLKEDIKIASVALLEIKWEKNPGVNGIQTYGLCDIAAGLYQLRYEDPHIVSGSIGHFRVPPGLCFKTRVGAQPLIWKSSFILMQIKLIFTKKVVHLASFWKWGFLELGSGLFSSCLNSWKEWMNFFQVNLKLVKLLLQLKQSHHHLNLHFRNSHHHVINIGINTLSRVEKKNWSGFFLAKR